MKFFFEFLLPSVVDNTIQGMKFPVHLFTLIAIVSSVRSCIHLLAPDGGAGSIAGMDLTVAGASGIIFAFGLWEAHNDLRVHSTGGGVPLSRWCHSCICCCSSKLLSHAGGRMKPVTFSPPPPGHTPTTWHCRWPR